jgi:hypothetical protein
MDCQRRMTVVEYVDDAILLANKDSTREASEVTK